jgi:hypothetical protein
MLVLLHYSHAIIFKISHPHVLNLMCMIALIKHTQNHGTYYNTSTAVQTALNYESNHTNHSSNVLFSGPSLFKAMLRTFPFAKWEKINSLSHNFFSPFAIGGANNVFYNT